MKETADCNRKKIRVYSYACWSSNGEADGDSERRQVQRAENWCARRGLNLTGGEKDDGVSAWNGKNRSQGSGLSRLLKLVQEGDYLLIEDLDRLSRQDWLTSMNFVSDILAKGVTVVTLSNGNEITRERFGRDPGCFLPALMRAFLGNDENEKKSKRIKESWAARKMKLASGLAAKSNLPCWLAWDQDADKPVLVEKNAAVIRKMFTLALEGLGCQTIARKLHRDGDRLVVMSKRQRRERVPTISASYVWRTLRNKMVIGTATYVVPPQAGVYPAVVDEQTFCAVQARIDQNKHQTAPRKHADKNLLTGLAHCSKCGGTLCMFSQYRKHSNGQVKTYRYMVCSGTLHKHGGCGMTSVRYDRLESSFLNLLTDSGAIRRALAAKPDSKPSPVTVLQGELANAERQAAKFMEFIKGDPNPSRAVYAALKEAEAKADELRARIEEETARKWSTADPLEVWEKAYKLLAGCIEPLTPYCNDADGQALLGRAKALIERVRCLAQPVVLRPENRAQLREMIRDVVDRVVVHLGYDRYEVYLKGSQQPIEVVLNKNKSGWGFSPAPLWVTDQSSFEKKDAGGEFTNRFAAVATA